MHGSKKNFKGGGSYLSLPMSPRLIFGNLKEFEFAGGIDPPDPPPLSRSVHVLRYFNLLI